MACCEQVLLGRQQGEREQTSGSHFTTFHTALRTIIQATTLWIWWLFASFMSTHNSFYSCSWIYSALHTSESPQCRGTLWCLCTASKAAKAQKYQKNESSKSLSPVPLPTLSHRQMLTLRHWQLFSKCRAPWLIAPIVRERQQIDQRICLCHSLWPSSHLCWDPAE